MPNELASVTWSSKLSRVVVGSGDDAISTALMAAYKAECLIYMYAYVCTHTHAPTHHTSEGRRLLIVIIWGRERQRTKKGNCWSQAQCAPHPKT